MVSIIKSQTKPNAFVLTDLDVFTFVEVRVPPREARIIEMRLYQRVEAKINLKNNSSNSSRGKNKLFASCIGILDFY